MADEKKKQSDVINHAPMPYVVRLRVSAGEDADAPSQLVEVRTVAYSCYEAAMQAFLQASGISGLEAPGVKIESIDADWEAYVKRVVSEVQHAR